MSLKAYVDCVAKGINYLESSSVRHLNSYGEDGDAYLYEKDKCYYIKIDGKWELFTVPGGMIAYYFYWCSACRRKHDFVIKEDTCPYCRAALIELDITLEIYNELPFICTKGDIVEASIGKIGGL